MEQILYAGAHPDDFSAGCGTMLRLKDKYQIHLWDFTCGERGLIDQGVSMDECAAMRRQEESNIARRLGLKLEFLGEVDGEAFASRERCMAIAEKLKVLRPKAVFTHFIPDSHPDHMMCTVALLKAIRLARLTPEIYFFEFNHQSKGFVPDILVDISQVMEEKLHLIRMYESQNIDDGIAQNKLRLAIVRGEQAGVDYAEAFSCYGIPRAGQSSIFSNLS